MMRQLRWNLGLLAVALGLLAVNSAQAERVPSTKTVVPNVFPAQNNIFVPYTTNGYSTLGVYQGVAPKIYSSPDVQNTQYPDTKRVYNLPFWGSRQSFGDKSEGAAPRPPGPPFPSK